jgi:hypothetical protein
MSRAPSPRHLLLRTALRLGDPGAGAILAPAEEEAMRRATLDAAAASGGSRAGRLARPPRPAAPPPNRARRRGHLAHAGHPGTTARSALRLLGTTAAAAAAICVAVAVSWVSWQGRPWPRPADEARPRPLQQRSAMAARRPLPPALEPAAGGGAGSPTPVAATGDELVEIGHTTRTAGGTGVAKADHLAKAADVVEAAGRPAVDAEQISLAAEAPAAPSVTSAAVAEPGPEPGARAAAEAAGAAASLAPDASTEAGPSAPPRQVQFSLPGGTRVIWLVREPTSR